MKGLKPKLIPILLLALLVVAGILGLKFLRSRGEDQEETQGSTSRIEPVNQLPISRRPFTLIIPRSDGREVRIIVNRLENASQAEYELEYQAGTLLQGAFGKIDFTKEEAPVTRNILLGSCSAGGKCSYHEDVIGGTLLLRYANGETTALKSEWNFQVMSEQEGRFTSRDAKFTYDVGKNGLSARTFVIITQTMGLPAPVDGEVVGGPYAVSLPKKVSLRAREIELTMRTNTTDSNVKLLGWTEDGWKEYEATRKGKTLEAIVDQATTFVAVITPSTP